MASAGNATVGDVSDGAGTGCKRRDRVEAVGVAVVPQSRVLAAGPVEGDESVSHSTGTLRQKRLDPPDYEKPGGSVTGAPLLTRRGGR